MASQPDSHMAGINALPRWNPDNLGAGYKYDWRQPYDRADYQKFKEARAAADKARYAKAQADLKKAMANIGKIVAEKFKSEVKKANPNTAKRNF